MTSPATNRQFLLELARATLESLQNAPLESVTDVNPDAVKNSLKAALDWGRQEESAASLEAVAPSTGAEPSLGTMLDRPNCIGVGFHKLKNNRKERLCQTFKA